MDTVKLNAPMPEANKCPQCGTPLPSGALAGLCPACLLKMGAASDTIIDAKQKAFVPPTIAELAGIFPQLEILELIGKGGMGAVYKVRQKELDRIVALKILPPGIGDEPAFAGRFAREAKALAKLNHPGIVTLYEFGSVDNAVSASPALAAPRLFYFLMEFVDGVNLRQLLQNSRVAPREALAIVPQICDALQFAHDQGIVHRDIKPENILLDRRGRVKVADFGLAKIVGTDAPLTPSLSPSDGERVAQPGEETPVLTDAGKVMGTPQYMSPEQIHAPGEVDHRADIYALGVVFYQMLTGELPGKKIEAPSKKVQIDVRLDEIVLRALEKNPELRYQQVSEVKTCVETIAATPDSSRPSLAMLKSERARLAVQESTGANVKYPTMGEVALYADRLVISSGYKQRSIPLTDIRGLGEAAMPFWFSPGPHRYASVAFDEAGQRRHLVFLAGSSVFRSPGDTRLHAAEWLTAIQQAVKSASGREVPITQVPTIVPVKTWWTLLWLAVPLVAILPLLAKFLLVPQRGAAGSSLMDVGLIIGAFLLVPALALFVVYIARSISLRHTGLKSTGEDASGTNVPPVEPRFSRTAIVGAAWAATALLAFAIFFVTVATATTVFNKGSTTIWWWRAFVHFNRYVTGPIGWTGIIGVTVLGWVAVSQIRRSAGKLHGLWLAVFDSLVFPLLALDSLMFVLFYRVIALIGDLPYFRISHAAGLADGITVGYHVAVEDFFLFCLVPFVLLYVDWLIIRRVWRAVNQGGTGVAPADSGGSRREEAHAESGKPAGKSSWLASPLASPEVHEISAHLTKEERSEAALYGLLWGGWVVAVAFGNFWLIKSFSAPGCWIVASVIVALFFASLPPWFRLQRRFLYSTVWAKEHGYTAGQVKLFSFKQRNVLRMAVVLVTFILLAVLMDKMILHLSGTSELLRSINEEIARSKIFSASRSTTADFHYRILLADAALVDRLIPVEQRQGGVESNVKPELVEAQVTAASTNGVFTKTDSQMAMIKSDTLGALLAGMEAKPGLLVDERRNISLQQNDSSPGTAIGWAHGFADRTLSAGTAGGGLVKLQRQGGILKARIECQFQYRANNNPNPVLSKILYDGSAPPSGIAQAFLVPFVSNDKTAHYLVIVFDLGNLTEQAVPAAAAQNFSSGPSRTLSGPPFVARLNQAEVELVAVGNLPWTNPVCWLPNGQPSAEPFPTGNFQIGQWSADMAVKKIVFHIRNESAEGISIPVCRINEESGAQPASSGWAAPDKRTPDGYFGQIIVCPSNAVTMNISVGVANGPWETATTLRSGLGGSGSADGDWNATYQAVAGKSGDVAVGCTYSKNTDWESRMAYVDGNGKVIPIQENSSHAGDNNQTGATLLVSSNDFARIQEFRLQRRKYQWVEFLNVSLQSGHLTTVTVKDSGSATNQP